MRFLNSTLLVLAAGAAVAACSASAGDGTGLLEEDAGSDASASQDAGKDAKHDSSSGQDATATDSSTQDTSTADTSADSAADTAADTAPDSAPDASRDTGPDVVADAGHTAPGTPCSPVNSIETQYCGLCGSQSRVCLAPDGGQAVWQGWGGCQNEVVGGCTPGTQMNETCGLCGTRAKQCQNDCTWAVGGCTGQPMNACSPGAIDYQPGLSCDAGGRERTCDNTCQWGSYGNCIVFDGGSVNALVIPLTVGSAATNKVITLKSPGIARINPVGSTSGSCVIDTTVTVDEYLEIFNPTNLTATVSVWTSGATSGTFDTICGIYGGATIPPSSRTMCVKYNDDCSTAPCVGSLMCGFISGSPDTRPTIPPGQSVVIYVGAYSSTTVSRDVQVNVRTDVLQ